MEDWNDFYERRTDEIIKTTRLDGDVIISTVKALDNDTVFGPYHTAITIGGRSRNIAEGYWEREYAAAGHELFVEMSFDDLYDYKCAEYYQSRRDLSRFIIDSEVSLEKLKEIQRIRVIKCTEANEKRERERIAKEAEELRDSILNVLMHRPNNVLIFIGKHNTIQDKIRRAIDETAYEDDDDVFFFYPYKLVETGLFMEILYANIEEISKNEEHKEAISELKLVHYLYGDKMTIAIEKDY